MPNNQSSTQTRRPLYLCQTVGGLYVYVSTGEESGSYKVFTGDGDTMDEARVTNVFPDGDSVKLHTNDGIFVTSSPPKWHGMYVAELDPEGYEIRETDEGVTIKLCAIPEL